MVHTKNAGAVADLVQAFYANQTCNLTPAEDADDIVCLVRYGKLVLIQLHKPVDQIYLLKRISQRFEVGAVRKIIFCWTSSPLRC